MNVGVQVYNSIDGSLSFGAGVFTFREICGNGVIMGKKDIRSIHHVHTKGLENLVIDLKNNMVLMMEEALHVVEAYQRMEQRKVAEKLLKQIRKSSLPKKVLPEYALAEEAILDLPTEWDLYNDITQAIWHSQTASIDRK